MKMCSAEIFFSLHIHHQGKQRQMRNLFFFCNQIFIFMLQRVLSSLSHVVCTSKSSHSYNFFFFLFCICHTQKARQGGRKDIIGYISKYHVMCMLCRQKRQINFPLRKELYWIFFPIYPFFFF